MENFSVKFPDHKKEEDWNVDDLMDSIIFNTEQTGNQMIKAALEKGASPEEIGEILKEAYQEIGHGEIREKFQCALKVMRDPRLISHLES